MTMQTRKEAMYRKQEAYIHAIASGESRNEAAESAGVTRFSVMHWRKDPVFAEIEAETEQRVEDARTQRRRQRMRRAAGMALRDAPPRRA